MATVTVRGNKSGYFCGSLMSEVSVRNTAEIIAVNECGLRDWQAIQVPQLAEIEMLLLIDSAYAPLLDPMLEHDVGIQTLGSGRVCPYCGDYNPAGLAHCHRCGGQTEWRPNVQLRRLPFLLAEYERSMSDAGLAMLRLSFVSDSDVCLDEDIAALTGQSETAWLFGESGYYLCQHCGQSVREGEKCPSCAGTRIPWSEILKMDHECLYCGTRVFGSIVCPNCGRRLAGKTVADGLQRRRTA
jgi:hypothetical protein